MPRILNLRHIPEDELHAYLDQALSRSQCVEIERHLAGCHRCRAERDAHRRPPRPHHGAARHSRHPRRIGPGRLTNCSAACARRPSRRSRRLQTRPGPPAWWPPSASAGAMNHWFDAGVPAEPAGRERHHRRRRPTPSPPSRRPGAPAASGIARTRGAPDPGRQPPRRRLDCPTRPVAARTGTSPKPAPWRRS